MQDHMTITLLGVRVDLLDIQKLNKLVSDAIARDEKWIIANHNLHSVYLHYRNPRMRSFFTEANVVHIDGMSLVFWARLLGYPVKKENRISYLDWIHPLMATASSKRWRVFHLGGKPGVPDRAAEKLRQRYPGLVLEVHHGYFTPKENDFVLEKINCFKAHVLMVGMGMPRQEYWILDNLDRIRANAILTAGACFDYIAGEIPTPPRWMGRVGLEWLYRLISEPQRLSRRYLVEPWSLVSLMIKDLQTRFWERNRM